jgi:hypothetical protein
MRRVPSPPLSDVIHKFSLIAISVSKLEHPVTPHHVTTKLPSIHRRIGKFVNTIPLFLTLSETPFIIISVRPLLLPIPLRNTVNSLSTIPPAVR